jgi:hypothetical protein
MREQKMVFVLWHCEVAFSEGVADNITSTAQAEYLGGVFDLKRRTVPFLISNLCICSQLGVEYYEIEGATELN